jgi:hypothetical protein
MNALIEWVQRIAGYGSQHPPPRDWSDDNAELEAGDADWTWIAMFPGDMPVGLMELLVLSGRRRASGSDAAEPNF